MKVREGVQRLRVLGGLLFLLGVFTSCDASRKFEVHQPLTDHCWEKNQELQFQFEVHDTVSKHHLVLKVRNTNAYAFSNLFVIAKMRFPSAHVVIDTFAYEMADLEGNWLGKGFAEVKERSLDYKNAYVFKEKGVFQVVVAHAMRSNGAVEGIDCLEGVASVGLRVELAKK